MSLYQGHDHQNEHEHIIYPLYKSTVVLSLDAIASIRDMAIIYSTSLTIDNFHTRTHAPPPPPHPPTHTYTDFGFVYLRQKCRPTDTNTKYNLKNKT